jgi:hypothetical protein
MLRSVNWFLPTFRDNVLAPLQVRKSKRYWLAWPLKMGRAPGHVWTHAENLASPGIDARTVQSVAYRLTDYAIPAHLAFIILYYYGMLRHAVW